MAQEDSRPADNRQQMNTFLTYLAEQLYPSAISLAKGEPARSIPNLPAQPGKVPGTEDPRLGSLPLEVVDLLSNMLPVKGAAGAAAAAAKFLSAVPPAAGARGAGKRLLGQGVAEAAPAAATARVAPAGLPGDPAPGMVRLYHGGHQYDGGTRWVTTSRKYAETGYTTPGVKEPRKNARYLHYVDVPESDPLVARAPGGGELSFIAPEELSKQLKPFYGGAPAAPQSGDPVAAANALQALQRALLGN